MKRYFILKIDKRTAVPILMMLLSIVPFYFNDNKLVDIAFMVAAIALMVEEAGGKASRIDGAPLEFVDAEQAIFSNGVLHDTLIRTLAV